MTTKKNKAAAPTEPRVLTYGVRGVRKPQLHLWEQVPTDSGEPPYYKSVCGVISGQNYEPGGKFESQLPNGTKVVICDPCHEGSTNEERAAMLVRASRERQAERMTPAEAAAEAEKHTEALPDDNGAGTLTDFPGGTTLENMTPEQRAALAEKTAGWQPRKRKPLGMTNDPAKAAAPDIPAELPGEGPPKVAADGTIIDGHARIEAARAVGMNFIHVQWEGHDQPQMIALNLIEGDKVRTPALPVGTLVQPVNITEERRSQFYGEVTGPGNPNKDEPCVWVRWTELLKNGDHWDAMYEVSELMKIDAAPVMPVQRLSMNTVQVNQRVWYCKGDNPPQKATVVSVKGGRIKLRMDAGYEQTAWAGELEVPGPSARNDIEVIDLAATFPGPAPAKKATRAPEQAKMNLIPNRSAVHATTSNVALEFLPPDSELYGDPPDADMVASVRSYGVITPILVIDFGPSASPRYQVIDGRNRIKAARAVLANWRQESGTKPSDSVPARFFPPDWTPAEVLSLIANERRRRNPVSDIAAIEKLIHQGHSVDAIATAVGLSKSEMQARMKLLALDGELKDALYDQKLGMRLAERIAREPVSRQKELVQVYRRTGRLTTKDLQDAKQAGAAVAASSFNPALFKTPDSAGPATDQAEEYVQAAGERGGRDWWEVALTATGELVNTVPADQTEIIGLVDKLRARLIAAFPARYLEIAKADALDLVQPPPGLTRTRKGATPEAGDPPVETTIIGGRVIELQPMPEIAALVQPTPLPGAAAVMSATLAAPDAPVELDGHLYYTMAVPALDGDIPSVRCPICSTEDGPSSFKHRYLDGVWYCPVHPVQDDDRLAAEFGGGLTIGEDID